MPKSWKVPPAIKVLEALGAVADGRIHRTGGGQASVVSSDGSRSYSVEWRADSNTVSCNDNGSYWQGYLGYPAIAYLMEEGELPLDRALAAALAGIEWKKLNTKLKDYEAVLKHIAEAKAIDLSAANRFAEVVLDRIRARQFLRPDKLPFPPK